MEQVKVGGETSAYCTSCREMRLHVIVAMVGRVPARVECRSCHKQHNYKAGPPGSSAAKKQPSSPAAPRQTRAKQAQAATSASEHPLDALLAVRSASEAKEYSPLASYVIGDLLRHPSFGLGAVSAAPAPGKIEVIFRDTCKLLLHNRPPAGSEGPKLQPPPRREDLPRTGASDAPPKR